jgi:hypothetical protein
MKPSHRVIVGMLRAQCRQTGDDEAELLLEEVQVAQLNVARRDAAPTSSFQHLRAPSAVGPQQTYSYLDLLRLTLVHSGSHACPLYLRGIIKTWIKQDN